MTNRIVLSGGANCPTEMVGGKRRKYHKKSMKRHGSRKSKVMKKSRRHSRKMMKKGGSRRHLKKSMKKRRSRKSKAMRKSMKKRRSRKSKAMKKSRRHRSRKGGSRKSRGAGVVHRAALPFGLLALQKMMHRRKSRKSLKKIGKRVLKAPYRTAKFLL
tara:strand:+ start:14341 stop:14814 length:474 start_codon:yes stop_codon:yes gene_type:complete